MVKFHKLTKVKIWITSIIISIRTKSKKTKTHTFLIVKLLLIG
jgi:hypothetical protein